MTGTEWRESEANEPAGPQSGTCWTTRETVLWGLREGAEDWQEEVIVSTSDPERLKAARAWAESNGFDRFRSSVLDLAVAPDFRNVLNTRRRCPPRRKKSECVEFSAERVSK